MRLLLGGRRRPPSHAPIGRSVFYQSPCRPCWLGKLQPGPVLARPNCTMVLVLPYLRGPLAKQANPLIWTWHQGKGGVLGLVTWCDCWRLAGALVCAATSCRDCCNLRLMSETSVSREGSAVQVDLKPARPSRVWVPLTGPHTGACVK